MKLKLDRIIGIATLIASLTAILLVVRKTAPVAPMQAPAMVVQQSPPTERPSAQLQPTPPQGTQQSAPASELSEVAPRKVATPARATAPVTSASSASSNLDSDSSSKTQSNSDAVGSALAEMLGGAAGAAALSPNSNVGNGTPVIKDQQVTMDGDVVHGKFLTQIGGKEVWVTISGRMGEKDGYATFDPTEFKVGDTSVPVLLVNPLLQRKLAEERDRLKIPNPE